VFSGNLVLNGGVVEWTNAAEFTMSYGTGAGQFTTTGNGGGFAAFGADRTVNIDGNVSPTTFISQSSKHLTFGSTTADGTLIFRNPISLGGTGVSRDLQIITIDGPTSVEAQLLGALTVESGDTLIFRGNGTTRLSATNSIASTRMNVSGGTLLADSDAALGSGTIRMTNAVAGQGDAGDAAVLTNGAMTITKGFQIHKVVNFNNRAILGGATAHDSTFSGNVTLGFTTTQMKDLTVTAAAGGKVTFTGKVDEVTGTNLIGGVTKIGAGKVVLGADSAYAGATTVSAGTLVAGADSPSSTVANSAITVDAATDVITLVGNPLVAGNKVIFSFGAGGSAPGGLTAGTTYFVRDVSGDTFKVSTTSGGTAVNVTTNGSTVTASRPGAFGAGSSAIVLGDANTGASSVSLLTGGAFTVGRPVTVANVGSGTTIGGDTDTTSTFAGAVGLARDLSVTQVATTGGNALNLTGSLSASTGGLKTVTFAGPGAISVGTSGIADGSGQVGVGVSGGTTTLSASNTYSGPTSISGGTLVLAGAGSINNSSGVTFDGPGATFLTNSSVAVSVPITLNEGTIGGTGDVGVPVSVGADSSVSPGNTPGTQNYTAGMTFAAGGTYVWEINDAAGSAGTNWDLLNVSGTLNITATSGNPFMIDVVGLNGSNVPGAVTGWDENSDASWTIASASNVVGFDTDAFSVLTGNFANNNTVAADFSVELQGNDLVLVYDVGSLLLGDWDFSGTVQNADIQAMLDALVDLDGYKAEHGLDDEELKEVGDLDGDDAVTNADIQAMLDYLTGGGGLAEIQALSLEVFGDAHVLDGYASSVPEPASLALAGMAGVTLLRRRRTV
jgi:MYXO-CTERM domain-containing protein